MKTFNSLKVGDKIIYKNKVDTPCRVEIDGHVYTTEEKTYEEEWEIFGITYSELYDDYLVQIRRDGMLLPFTIDADIYIRNSETENLKMIQ